MSKDERVNILMVDDQPGKLLSYEVMLDGLGENLIKANSAKEALEDVYKRQLNFHPIPFLSAPACSRRSRETLSCFLSCSKTA